MLQLLRMFTKTAILYSEMTFGGSKVIFHQYKGQFSRCNNLMKMRYYCLFLSIGIEVVLTFENFAPREQ